MRYALNRALVVLTVGALVGFGTTGVTRAGDTDDGPRYSRLEFLPAPLGGATGLDLRTASPSMPFVLFLDTDITSVDPDGAGRIPWMRVFGPATTISIGVADAIGRARILGPVGNDAGLQGMTVFAQALSFTPSGDLESSNVAATTVTPGAPTWSYADRSGFVPPLALADKSWAGAAEDLDDDGDPDLVLVTGAAATVRVYRNDGFFFFTDVTSTAVPAQALIETRRMELFDADGDGRIDIFLAGGEGAPGDPPLPILLLLNQGGLSFQVAPIPDVAGVAQDVAVVDADGDGDLDLLVANGRDSVHANEQPDVNTLLVNQGNAQGGTQGEFVADAAFSAAPWNGSDFNIAISAGDIDNDGDLDLLVARSDTQALDGVPGQPNVLLRNDGSLSFTDVSSTHLQPWFSDNSQGVRFGDVDGDGFLDLMVANSTVSVLSIDSGDYYRNQGNGQFVEDNASFPQIDESEISLRVGVHLDDVDLDGDLDVIQNLHEFFDFDMSTGNQTGGDDLLFLNQGGAQGGVLGNFVMDPLFTAFGIYTSRDMVVADFDLDGDNDLYICNSGGLFGPPVNDHMLENTRIP